MNEVWVVCVEYDYGVVSRAGFFKTQREAERWIQSEHLEDFKLHKELLEEYPEVPEIPTEFLPERYYAKKLDLNEEEGKGCLANGCEFSTIPAGHMRTNGPCRCYECRICGGGHRAFPFKHKDWCWMYKNNNLL